MRYLCRMKLRGWILGTAAACVFLCGCANESADNRERVFVLDIATYNMLWVPKMPNDKEHISKRHFDVRKGPLADMFRENAWDIVASQELQAYQIREFSEILGAEYAYVEGDLREGVDESLLVGRKTPKNDRIELTMHNAIWYRRGKFEVLDRGLFQLADAQIPFPRFGFDAEKGQFRFCTWAKFKSPESGRIFFVFSTHLNSSDYADDAERVKSTTLLAQKVPEIAKGHPFFLCGDFNAFATAESVKKITLNPIFKDARAISETPPKGPRMTYSEFGRYDADPTQDRIDYIFTSGKIKVLSYAVIAGKRRGHYPSDHYPVSIRAEIE